MKKNKIKRIILWVFMAILIVVTVILAAYLILVPNNKLNIVAFPLFLAMLIGIYIIVFYLRFRLRTEEYDYNNVEYERYRADLEEKIRVLQNAINKDNERWMDNNHLVVSAVENKDKLFEQFGVSSQQEITPNSVFMLMPFNPEAVKVYDQCKKTVEALGMRLSKSDDESIEGDLLKHIINSIVKAEIIIANLDGKNPNVFYELGIAHALKKPTILITSYSPKEVPFNLQSRNIIFFSNPQELNLKLGKALEYMKASEE